MRERHTQNPKQAQLWAISTEPDMELEPMNCEIMTWAKVGRPTDWATQVFQFKDIFKCKVYTEIIILSFYLNFILFIYFNFFNVYFRDRAQVGEGQREPETESEAGCRLWAVSTEPDTGLEPTNREIMTWAEVGRLNDWATQAPLNNAI